MRIDDEAKRISQQATRIASQLAEVANSTLAFAAFMHTDPSNEFTQEDRDKYSEQFAVALGALNAELSKLVPLAGIEAGAVTVADFLAAYNGELPSEYSKRFD